MNPTTRICVEHC